MKQWHSFLKVSQILIMISLNWTLFFSKAIFAITLELFILKKFWTWMRKHLITNSTHFLIWSVISCKMEKKIYSLTTLWISQDIRPLERHLTLDFLHKKRTEKFCRVTQISSLLKFWLLIRLMFKIIKLSLVLITI